MAYTGIIAIQAAGRTTRIPVLSFTWNVNRAGQSALIEDFSFVKRADATSPELFLHCCSGTRLPEVRLTLRAADGGPTLVYTFGGAGISGFHPRGSPENGDGFPLEEISLRFDQCELDYWPGEAGNGAAAGQAHGGWNILRNAAA